MNNIELYRKTFSKLHASDTLDMEVIKMKNKGNTFRCRRSLVVMAAVLAVMMAMSAIAYAATGGEILHTVKVWIGGESKELAIGDAIKSEDGQFTIKVKDVTESSVELGIHEGDPAEE